MKTKKIKDNEDIKYKEDTTRACFPNSWCNQPPLFSNSKNQWQFQNPLDKRISKLSFRQAKNGLQLRSGSHGISLTVMDDWLSWTTFMDDFHGWLSLMLVADLRYFYILFTDEQTDRHWYLISCYRDWKAKLIIFSIVSGGSSSVAMWMMQKHPNWACLLMISIVLAKIQHYLVFS